MRDTSRPRRRTAIVAGLVVTALAGLALTALHRTPRPAVPPRVAIHAALANPGTAQALAGSHWNRVSASPLDGELERVDFWDSSQIQVGVAVDAHRQVVQEQNFSHEPVPYGDWLAYQPALLIGLSILFLLVTVVLPWRRMRNLDALAALSFVLPVVLFQHRYLDPSLLAAGPGLLYLAARCAWRGLGPATEPAPSRPLLTALARRPGGTGRIRWLRVTLGVVALIFVMIGVSSPLAVDVTYAVMEGATTLIHGALPYGHMPTGILHGDTYPILSYALYTPLVAVAAALIAAWAAWRAAAGRRGRGRTTESEEAGLRAALAVLAFPAVMITASTGTTDVVLASMLGIVLLLWRRPAAAAATLAVAGWFKLAPFALVPVLLASLRGRRLVGALGALAAVSTVVLVLVVVVGGIHGPREMAHAVAYQFTRGSVQSMWSALGIEWAQPIAQAAVLGLIVAVTVRMWQEPGLAADEGRVAAVSASVLIGIQLAANYWAFLYLAWVVPLLSVSLLHPGLGARRRLARLPADTEILVPALAA